MVAKKSTAGLNWQQLPKIDLHRHFEGSIPLGFVLKHARNGAVPLPPELNQLASLLTIQPGDPKDPETFLAPFSQVRKIFQDEEIIRQAARAVIAAAAEEHIRYLELHLTPTALASASGAVPVQTVRWLCQAASEAATEHDLMVSFIVSLNRHESLSQAEQSVAAAVELQSEGVVAVDLAGNEADYSAEEFEPLLRQAKSAGLKISVHAGEWAGPESVAFAINQLEADRIVHGVRIMEREELVRQARDLRLPIAVCLTSNLQSGVVDRMDQHPLPMMIAAGLQITLGTDDPAISRTNLAQEFSLAVEHLGLSDDSLRGIVLAGSQAAFLERKERQQLEADFQRWLGLAPELPSD